MIYDINQATQEHIPGIIHITQQAWGISVGTAYLSSLLREDDRTTHVAITNDEVVGYIDAFITVSAEGKRRWEVDLLAVQDDFQGNGIAKALVQASVQYGRIFECEIARALTAVNNVAVHAVFNANDYICDKQAMYLYTIEQGYSGIVSTTERGYILPVNTIGYRGLWLEGNISNTTIQSAQFVKETYDFDLIGAVIASTEEGKMTLLEKNNFRRIGNYYWWMKPLK